MSRADTIATFLAGAGWGAAARTPLAGDASRRRYERLARQGGAHAVLMDAPPEAGEDVRPFVAVAGHLRALGLSPPAILAAAPEHGLLLLEDLGDALFVRVAAESPARERTLYAAAVDVLVALHAHAPLAGAPAYGPEAMADRVRLAALWYRPGLTGRPPDASDADAADALEAATRRTLAALPAEPDVLVLRDYHAENLLWLPERAGHARVGLLDFQDAAAGHPAYDLVSLLQDARRDVAPALHDAMIDRYARATGRTPEGVAAACAVLGAQRALRILGVFARLPLRDGKPGYADLLPRVWGLLRRDLAHPACADIADVAGGLLPPPAPEGLDRLRARAGTMDDPAPAAP